VKKLFQEMAATAGKSGCFPEVAKIASTLSSSDSLEFIDCVSMELWACLPKLYLTSLDTFHSNYRYVKNVELAFTDSEKRDMLISHLSNNLEEKHSPESLQYVLGRVTLELPLRLEAFF